MTVQILVGDVLRRIRDVPTESVRCCVTSPPYWGLRDYGVAGQMGLEASPDAWVRMMVRVFRQVRRTLTKDGTLWLNVGDCYADGGRGRDAEARSTLRGSRNNQRESRKAKVRERPGRYGIKPKDLIGLPWLLALALRKDGWYLRRPIIWHKPNPMPESVRDRPTVDYEYVFLMAKSRRYYFDQMAGSEPVSLSTHLRVSQDVAAQAGSARANGGSRADRPMHAVVRGSQGAGRPHAGRRDNGVGFGYSDTAPDVPAEPATNGDHPASEQDGHGRRHAGFNGRWKDRTKPKSEGTFSSTTVEIVDRRNVRSVWTIPTQAFKGAHFATFPEELARRCIVIGSKRGDTVLDPFGGSGTTGLVADRLGRKATLIELNPAYAGMARDRILAGVPLLGDLVELG